MNASVFFIFSIVFLLSTLYCLSQDILQIVAKLQYDWLFTGGIMSLFTCQSYPEIKELFILIRGTVYE